MSPSDTPMNAAHQHAANADDYLAKGLIVMAAEEHYQASVSYIAAIERSNDESAKRTLRMLYNEHCKAAKELQRKIDQLKAEGKDPSLPQKSDIPKNPPPRQNSNSYAGPSRVNTSSPQPLRAAMTDSQNAGDESFMLLGGQRSDPGDAFNQFWNIMQGMLDNLSQPVAFATAPLDDPEFPNSPSAEKKPEETRKDDNLSSDTDADEPIFSRFTRKIGMSREGSKSSRSRKNSHETANTNLKKAAYEDDDDFEDFLEAGDDLSGSFFLIPSGAEPSPAVLKKENETLKAEINSMKSRLEATERAQRALGTSTMLQRPGPPLDFSSLNIDVPAVPIPGINTGREAQYARRVKELEDELRLMRVENEKNVRHRPSFSLVNTNTETSILQKLMIAKFRERWEKLKDSAKRKKEAKAAAEAASTGVRERIIEEPEAEEELDESNPRG
ncbi:hypothetical protein JR316_0003235 [Psilocybe cubensis]|uniref:MIT domain-containing protein n=2 Tax=Psilocybe cubensis TaxID=181762 RepID=A0A8H7Y214_PSICU|nr:hypothetical protein JR316_0003235 [Psilocybe cubensis]KAH9483759.1 hypothetical protein JR316_0003235 [Psilocybe cubensis]